MFQMESILMERLVWIRYRCDRYWWPAILYQRGYHELIHQAVHVWNSQVSLLQRMLIVHCMIFDPTNPRNDTPVARVLGRPGCELIELPRRSHTYEQGKPELHPFTADFFWQLPKILPVAACNIEFFAQDGDYDLYYDWHRALDQVECLLYDCLGKHMPLLSPPVMLNETTAATSKKTQKHWKYATTLNSSAFTWVQRARQAERMQWEEHRKYVGCVLFMCGPEEEHPQQQRQEQFSSDDREASSTNVRIGEK
jgi:hypothetical protein